MTDITIAFDLDGTLVDTAPDLIGALNVAIGLEGLDPIEVADAKSVVGAGARAMITRALAMRERDITPERFEELTNAFLDHYAANIAALSQPFPGIEAALDRLAADGARLVVCTNKLERFAVSLLDSLGMSHRFAAICGGDTFGAPKPDPRCLLGTIARGGGDAARAVMIGDSITDLKAARASGVPVVLVDFGYTDIPARELGADAVIGHFDQLAPALSRLRHQAGAPA